MRRYFGKILLKLLKKIKNIVILFLGDRYMKKKIIIGLLIVAFIIILIFLIPIKKETKLVSNRRGSTPISADWVSSLYYKDFYYNIFCMQIWSHLDSNEYILYDIQ